MTCPSVTTHVCLAVLQGSVFGIELPFVIQAKDTCNNKRTSGGDDFKVSTALLSKCGNALSPAAGHAGRPSCPPTCRCGWWQLVVPWRAAAALWTYTKACMRSSSQPLRQAPSWCTWSMRMQVSIAEPDEARPAVCCQPSCLTLDLGLLQVLRPLLASEAVPLPLKWATPGQSTGFWAACPPSAL